jgi:hypothetical protein
LVDDKIPDVMVDHEPTTTRMNILINKLVVAGQHIDYGCLDDKCVDTHDELREHGNESVVNLVEHD